MARPFASATVADFAVMSWLGIAAPAGTPPPIVQRLNAEIQAVLSDPDLRKRLEENGSRVTSGSPGDLRQTVVSEIARWKEVIAKAGIQQN